MKTAGEYLCRSVMRSLDVPCLWSSLSDESRAYWDVFAASVASAHQQVVMKHTTTHCGLGLAIQKTEPQHGVVL